MPTGSARRTRPIDAGALPANTADRPRPRLGRVPLLALTAGLGLLVCSLANALSRATLDPPTPLYWAGILIVALPIFYRLTSREATAGERLALVCLLGLSLYGVKLVHDAPLFAFSDELIHAFNADQIASHHGLFRYNPILPVTPYYPGLEGATSALATLTGLSSYWSGIVVVGAARLSLVAAMFLLFARIGGSARTAGLGVAIYAGNFNFLYWGAQYSYASLALPLLVVVLMALAEREASSREWARHWAAPIVLGTAAIVVTHHLTSYTLAAFLAALALVHRATRKDWSWPNPWRLAVFAAALAAAWLLLVASSTFGYIAPVLSDAFEAIFNTASGEAPPRTLFQGAGSNVPDTPLLARAVALLAVVLLAAALPFGLRRVWRRHRAQPFALVFALAALAFFATLALRLAPAAWETGNRASELLFVGLAFVVACAGLEAWRPRGSVRLGRAATAAALGVVLVGGAIAGWPWDLQLASPLRARAGDGTISSPPLATGEWARRNIPAGRRFAAGDADARLLMTPGERVALAGTSPDIEDILLEPAFSGWELPLLGRRNVRYVVTDRRELGSDVTRGYFFALRGEGEELLPKAAIAKFGTLPDATKIYANGQISVYDLKARP